MAMPHSWWLRHSIKGTEPRASDQLIPGGRSCEPHGAGAVVQRSLELQAGADLELGEQQIKPLRMTSMDIITLTEVERVAVLIHLVNDPDPPVAEAVANVTRKVLERTRSGEG
jgi:hypothetical protein